MESISLITLSLPDNVREVTVRENSGYYYIVLSTNTKKADLIQEVNKALSEITGTHRLPA